MNLYDNQKEVGYPVGAGAVGGLMSTLDPYSNSLKARLDRAVEQAEHSLADAKRAREIFVKFPELEELLNILQKGRI